MKQTEKDVKEMSMPRPGSGQRVDADALEAFERELTPDVARRLLELAARRAAMLRAAGAPLAPDYAKRLVQDAIIDTVASSPRWQAADDSLSTHLRGVIERRSLSELARHVDVRRRAEPADPPALFGELARQLDSRRAEDAAVRLLLDAYAAGAATRDEVMAHARLDESEYVLARRELDRLLARVTARVAAPESKGQVEP